jgi:hypothetical protein
MIEEKPPCSQAMIPEARHVRVGCLPKGWELAGVQHRGTANEKILFRHSTFSMTGHIQEEFPDERDTERENDRAIHWRR